MVASTPSKQTRSTSCKPWDLDQQWSCINGALDDSAEGVAVAGRYATMLGEASLKGSESLRRRATVLSDQLRKGSSDAGRNLFKAGRISRFATKRSFRYVARA